MNDWIKQASSARYSAESEDDSSPRPTYLNSPRDQAHGSSNEKLYECFNELHQLAQAFDKPFDAPAVVICGHQTDGKSALVEGLMGFQFNSVGGGTKTRKPIAIHMKYNSSCAEPSCYLLTSDTSGAPQERAMRLADLQAYIEAENNRLESEQRFSSREIVVRIEYRHCPNLTLIDTPGLISAAPGKKNEKLQGFSSQVEAIVKAKIEQREHIILCLEDSNDWTNATTRRLVMQVDPSLSRTVLVSTKFDTKLPQFARGADVETFLHPSKSLLGLGDEINTHVDAMMGNGRPFFTSVPSGRVGETKDDVFRSNDEFRSAVASREALDASEAEAKLGRKLIKEEKQQMGISQLRLFLEKLLQSKYLDSVPMIVPLLDKETRSVQSKLSLVKEELGGLEQDKMKEKGRALVEGFLSRLQLLLKGSATASVDKFGETTTDEHKRGGEIVLTVPLSICVLQSHALSHRRRSFCGHCWKDPALYTRHLHPQRHHEAVWRRPVP
jgi:GTPase SAR1 family protein